MYLFDDIYFYNDVIYYFFILKKFHFQKTIRFGDWTHLQSLFVVTHIFKIVNEILMNN